MANKNAEILSAVKSAGEAALRLHEDNKSMRERLRSTQNPGLAVRQQAADALERLTAENAALRAAAGKVACWRCEGSGEMEVYESLSSGVKLPIEPCSDCSDLRKLLEVGHE